MSLRDLNKVVNLTNLSNGAIYTIDLVDFEDKNLSCDSLSFGDILLLHRLKDLIFCEKEFSVSYGYKNN